RVRAGRRRGNREGGRLDPLYDTFFEALDGFDANRIRLCPIYRRIFFADRRNELACSDRCQDTNNARRYRERVHVYEANRAKREFEATQGLTDPAAGGAGGRKDRRNKGGRGRLPKRTEG